MSETILETMRSIRRKSERAEIQLCEAYGNFGVKNPEIRAHMDAVFGIVETRKSKTPAVKLQEGETFDTHSDTPKTNPNFPGPRPS